MTVKEIYERYQVPPWLQLHQVRVAAVGKMVANIQSQNIQSTDVILACLFHDMGNVLKFDPSPDSYFAAFFEEKGFAYWQRVQDDFRRRYGSDEHAAAVAIATEIGISSAAIAIINMIGFDRARELFARGSRELWIVQYADMRVGPEGIISLDQRIGDIKKRYAKHSAWFGDPNQSDTSENVLHAIEDELFKDGRIQPETINDATTALVMQELWDYAIA